MSLRIYLKSSRIISSISSIIGADVSKLPQSSPPKIANFSIASSKFSGLF
ncbi:MAG: hypothetical protein U9N42_05320 [Campylobacterota bacterium]|nr:hypothetical protein [Campylobacterota bacterium]